jgi:hypothetical protein
LRWDFARSYTNEVVRDFPIGDRSHDGDFAYTRAIRLENLALAQYQQVVQIYAALVNDGIVPNEDEWQQRRKGAGA